MVFGSNSESENIKDVYREGDSFVGISYNQELKGYIMHVALYDWSLSEYKRYKEIFKLIKKSLSRLTPEVYSLCVTQKHLKFNKMFGFKDTGLVSIGLDGQLARIAKLDLEE
jgi:FPC/CPF motif-containing protein YcgG